MYDPSLELRHQLIRDRSTSLRRSGKSWSPGPLRRIIRAGLGGGVDLAAKLAVLEAMRVSESVSSGKERQ